MPTQRYISPELTHFVGKGLSEDQQYSLLVNDILKAGWLMHPPIDDRPPNEVLRSQQLVGGSWTPDVDTTEAVYSQRICFCDIPVTDLGIHMKKYSRFGLSFLKRFLVDKGANPVLYVANNSPALPFGLPGFGDGPWPRRRVFEGNIQLFQDFHRKMFEEFPVPLYFFLSMMVFSFIKFFDDSTFDEAEANVYMEREWRVLGDINFALADVHRVFLPERYAERFRADLPTYTGQLTFSDNI
jgi:hypothetical protein